MGACNSTKHITTTRSISDMKVLADTCNTITQATIIGSNTVPQVCFIISKEPIIGLHGNKIKGDFNYIMVNSCASITPHSYFVNRRFDSTDVHPVAGKSISFPFKTLGTIPEHKNFDRPYKIRKNSQ